jgi:cytochrome c peroxidase
MKRAHVFRTLGIAAGLAAALQITAFGRSRGVAMQTFSDPTGEFRTYSTAGVFDGRNPFFQSLGTNGRSCSTCHQPGEAWTITPANVRARFDATGGVDPLFRTNDGSNSPDADVSTIEARRSAYSMLLSKGLIRVGVAVPANAEFELIGVDDPYGYASAKELSLFRRPLPATNLSALATVMWDGRETFSGQSIHFDLTDQANGATLGHAAATDPLSSEQREAIVAFESSLYTAQSKDNAAGDLEAQGALGGPLQLSVQPFFIGINDTLSAGYNPLSMSLYDSWAHLRRTNRDRYSPARESVARGQELFNTFKIQISGVRGVNDVLGQEVITGTCTTCHNAPNIGNHSVSLPLDLGISSEERRTADMPLYTFRNKTTGEVVKTTDPGRALITGKWNHMSVFKGPILRGVAARAPYFHNGSAATLEEVVKFYNDRFKLDLSDQQKQDLVAFLRSL